MFGTERRVVEVESLRSQGSDQTPAGVSMVAGPYNPPDRFVTLAPSQSRAVLACSGETQP
jgi:hypothetical protein